MNLAVISNRTTWAAKLEKLLTWCVWPERAVKMQHHRLQKAIVSQTCPAGAKITPNLHCHSSEGHYCVKGPKKRSTKYEIKSLGHFQQIFSITFLWFGYENNRCIASLSLCMYLTVLTVINSHLGCDEQDVVLNRPPLQHLCLSLPVMSLLGRLEIATCHARYWQYGAPFIRSSKLAKAFCLLHFWRFTYDIEIVHTFLPQET